MGDEWDKHRERLQRYNHDMSDDIKRIAEAQRKLIKAVTSAYRGRYSAPLRLDLYDNALAQYFKDCGPSIEGGEGE